MGGKPVLWIERQRHILRATPARNMMFDVLEESKRCSQATALISGAAM
jgi:hypothetical protein